MSIWTELLFLHGHLTQVPAANEDAERRPRTSPTEEADQLRELIGCPAPSRRRPEPRGPLLGVRGLA